MWCIGEQLTLKVRRAAGCLDLGLERLEECAVFADAGEVGGLAASRADGRESRPKGALRNLADVLR